MWTCKKFYSMSPWMWTINWILWKLRSLLIFPFNLESWKIYFFSSFFSLPVPGPGFEPTILRLTSSSMFKTSHYKGHYKIQLVQSLKVLWTIYNESWTNFSWQDEAWAKFSTLEVVARNAINLFHSKAIRSNLELKTRPKQLLGYLLLEWVNDNLDKK